MHLVETPKLLGAVITGNYTVLGKKTQQARILSSAFSIGCNKYIYYGSHSTPNRLHFDPLETTWVRMLRDVTVHVNLSLQISAIDINALVEISSRPTADLAFYYPQGRWFDILPEEEKEAVEEPDYDDQDSSRPLVFMNDFFFL